MKKILVILMLLGFTGAIFAQAEGKSAQQLAFEQFFQQFMEMSGQNMDSMMLEFPQSMSQFGLSDEISGQMSTPFMGSIRALDSLIQALGVDNQLLGAFVKVFPDSILKGPQSFEMLLGDGVKQYLEQRPKKRKKRKVYSL